MECAFWNCWTGFARPASPLRSRIGPNGRLFGLVGWAPYSATRVSPPRRPCRAVADRPPSTRDEAEALPPSPLPPERPITPIERRTIDYSELERGLAHLEQVVRDARRTLDVLARGGLAQPCLSREPVWMTPTSVCDARIASLNRKFKSWTRKHRKLILSW